MNKSRGKSGSLNLTKKADYGLFLLASLADKNSEIKSIKQIAEENNLSFLFLQKIAAVLQKGGLIKAARGKFGGYKLTKSPDKITIKEIFETLEGPIAIASCLAKHCKFGKKCKIKSVLNKINEEIKKSLFSKKLSIFLNLR